MTVRRAKSREDNAQLTVFSARVAWGEFLDDAVVPALLILGKIRDREPTAAQDLFDAEALCQEVLQG